MLKLKRGRPRLRSPSHHYSISQWRAHQNQSIQEGVLKALKKLGVFPLLEYSPKDLNRSVHAVHGVPPLCFGKGDIDTLPECKKCRDQDASSEVEGFYKPNGRVLGKNAFGIYCCCWILCWINSLRKLN